MVTGFKRQKGERLGRWVFMNRLKTEGILPSSLMSVVQLELVTYMRCGGGIIYELFITYLLTYYLFTICWRYRSTFYVVSVEQRYPVFWYVFGGPVLYTLPFFLWRSVWGSSDRLEVRYGHRKEVGPLFVKGSNRSITLVVWTEEGDRRVPRR